MARFLDLVGTTLTKLQIGLGAAGLNLKVAAGKLRARTSRTAPMRRSSVA